MLTVIRHKALKDNRVAVVITGYNVSNQWSAHLQILTIDTAGKYAGNTLVDRDCQFSTEFAAIDAFNNYED